MTGERLSPIERSSQILLAAVALAGEIGYLNISRDKIAKRAKCSVGLVTLRFKNMRKLRQAVMHHAVQNKILGVIGQGIAANDKIALTVSPATRKQAVASLA